MTFPYFGSNYDVEQHLVDHGAVQIYTGVYHVSDTETRSVLFKCLNLSEGSDWNAIQAFEQEAAILSALDHPRFPTFIAQKEIVYQNQRWLCLIQAYLAGESLQERLEQGPLPVEEVIDIAAQVLYMLQALHKAPPAILHLDLKPSNLLRHKQKIFLIDFGAAQLQGQPQSTVGGTPGYSPPEQLSGQPTVRSDLYALGATCAVLLSGMRIESLIVEQRIDFWEHIDCDAPLKNWLEIMVHPDAALRFDDTAQAVKYLPGAAPHNDIPTTLVSRSVEVINTAVTPVALPELEGYSFIEQKSVQGGISTWIAHKSQSPDEKVVIKQLNIPAIEDIKAFSQFEREIKNLEQLQDPHIPRLLDFIKTESRWFMVQQHLPGVSLAQKVSENWRPTTPEWYALAKALLETLERLHGQTEPLMHRDVQPEHILIDDNRVYLLGFGGAQQRFAHQGSGGSTRTGSFGYTAPEQYMGVHSPASDLFSAGMCLIYALRGRSPATYTWENQALKLEDLNLEAGFVKWLQRLTHLRVEERPVSATEALKGLGHLYELHVYTEQKARGPSKQERVARLREAEENYLQQEYEHSTGRVTEHWQDNPWIQKLSEQGISHPPTLRLQISSQQDRFELLIPGPSRVRESRLFWIRLLLNGFTYFSLFLILGGIFFPPLLVPIAISLALQFAFHTRIKPLAQDMQWVIKNKQLHIRQDWKRKTLDLSTAEHLHLVPQKSSFFLKANYHVLQYFDAPNQVLEIPGVFLLPGEVDWIEKLLSHFMEPNGVKP